MERNRARNSEKKGISVTKLECVDCDDQNGCKSQYEKPRSKKFKSVDPASCWSYSLKNFLRQQ